MATYKVLNREVFSNENHSIIPIRIEDRYKIMQWRNHQIYHLRQQKPLSKEDQDKYFEEVISGLFNQQHPNQILFSYLEGEKCIGYGGLVHINWQDKNAEISFIMDTALEKDQFHFHWETYLGLIEKVAFEELELHKIFTYAFDLRPHLDEVLEQCHYRREAVLKEHAFFDNQFIDVIIHSKIYADISLIRMSQADIDLTYRWATSKKIRKYALNQNEISFETHKRWFLNKIKDSDCEYFLFKSRDKVIGSVRFDIEPKENSAIISYLIDERFHGKGYGKLILTKGIDELKKVRPELKLVFGWVLNENIASLKIFERLNFSKEEIDELKTKFVLNI